MLKIKTLKRRSADVEPVLQTEAIDEDLISRIEPAPTICDRPYVFVHFGEEVLRCPGTVDEFLTILAALYEPLPTPTEAEYLVGP